MKVCRFQLFFGFTKRCGSDLGGLGPWGGGCREMRAGARGPGLRSRPGRGLLVTEEGETYAQGLSTLFVIAKVIVVVPGTRVEKSNLSVMFQYRVAGSKRASM